MERKKRERQLGWVAQELDERPDKPALVFGHYNMTPNRGVRPIRGLRDGPDLLEALTQRKHVRAYFYGHTHEWQHTRKKHLHLIGQPAVGYYFGKGHAHGWLDMKLSEIFADLELQCIDPKHERHGERKRMSLKEKRKKVPFIR